MKVKKWVKISYVLVILFFIYLIYSFILYNSYVKNRDIALHLTQNGKLLTEQVFPDIRVSKGIYILDNLSINNSFESIIKDNDVWKIKDKNDLSYNLKVNELENDNYRMYQYTVSNLDSIKNLKVNIFTKTSKKKDAIKLVKNINKYVPQYEEIFLVNSSKKHGYIYKYNGEINACIFIGEKKYQFIFENDSLEYKYIIDLLATISIDE